ncbi:hypothetical protein FRB90_011056, partial [Tulasnella sp. 427]
MAKAARAMGLPFGRGSAGNMAGAASTPKTSSSSFLSSTVSYFRLRHALDAEEQTLSTPTARSQSAGAFKEAPALHRRSLVASGAPSGERTPLGSPKVRVGMNREFDAPLPRTKNQQHLQQPPSQASSSSSPTSYRTPLYHTPLPTPIPSAFSNSTARETVYFDAESGGSDGEAAAAASLLRQAGEIALPDESGMSASTFTTFSMGSSSTLTATAEGPGEEGEVGPVRPTVHATVSAATVKPGAETTPGRPEMPHSEGSGSSGRLSALGLDLPAPVEKGSVRAARSESTSSQPLDATTSTPQQSASSQRGRNPSRDYFSSKPNANAEQQHHLSPSSQAPSTPGSQFDMLRSAMRAKNALSPRTSGGRPMIYMHQVSHSMLDFGSTRIGGEGAKENEDGGAPPARIPSTKGKGKAPPPPYPRVSIREEEGKEVLPPYTCRIHFEASVMRKMEFDHPGMLAKDRSWKRVYVVLNGTTLRIFKQNPRMYPVRPVPLKVGVRKAIKDWPAGGKNADGIVRVEDVTLGAPHVHLPEEILPKVDGKGVPLKKVPSGGSGASVGPTAASNSSRRSFDGGSRAGRRSFDLPRRAVGTSRSSMSSSSNVTAGSSSSAWTGPVSDSTMDLLVEDSEKGRPPPVQLGPSAVLGAAQPSNSQSAQRSTGSQILASIQTNTVLRQYTLQGAETGLASDYHKRKNVTRVKAEGEQFLIQAHNVFMAIDWIETFQAGANVSLDLDEGPMPKVPALPRRRRRRRPQNPTDGTQAAPGSGEPSNSERPGAPSREPSTVVVTAPTPSTTNSSRLFGRR